MTCNLQAWIYRPRIESMYCLISGAWATIETHIIYIMREVWFFQSTKDISQRLWRWASLEPTLGKRIVFWGSWVIESPPPQSVFFANIVLMIVGEYEQRSVYRRYNGFYGRDVLYFACPHRLVTVIAPEIENTYLVHGTQRWRRRLLQSEAIALIFVWLFSILYTAAGNSHARQNILFLVSDVIQTKNRFPQQCQVHTYKYKRSKLICHMTNS